MRSSLRLAIVLAVFVATCVIGPASRASETGYGEWLAKIDLDQGLPEQTKRNFERAIGAIDALFARYGLRVPSPVTVAVTANNEGYIRALMTYAHFTRQEAQKEATVGAMSLGDSLRGVPVIIIRWIPTRVARGDGTSYEVNNPEDAFFALPHEVFHQVQRSFRLNKVPVWLTEGPSSVFENLAMDQAGVATIAEMNERNRRCVLHFPPVGVGVMSRTIAYDEWIALTDAKVPTYTLSELMTGRLVGDRDFAKILNLYHLVDQGTDFDKAFADTFDMTIAEFERATDQYLMELRAAESQRPATARARRCRLGQ